MAHLYHHIAVEHRGEVCCVRMVRRRLTELDVHEMADEVINLIESEGCRKVLFCLGPGTPDCLFSVFLAKLVTLRRRLLEKEGQFKICEATPQALSVFDACNLHDYFDFYPDVDTGIASFER